MVFVTWNSQPKGRSSEGVTNAIVALPHNLCLYLKASGVPWNYFKQGSGMIQSVFLKNY